MPIVDIRDLISLEDVMSEMKLGPNGGLIYCMEYLIDNIDWIEVCAAPIIGPLWNRNPPRAFLRARARTRAAPTPALARQHALGTTHHLPLTTHHARRTYHLPPTTHHPLQPPPTTYHLPPTTYHLPPATYHLPPTIYHLPPATYHLPPTTHHAPLTTYHSPLTTYHSPLTTHHLPLTTHHVTRCGEDADTIRHATGLPVLDAITIVDFFHSALDENPHWGIDWEKLASTLAASPACGDTNSHAI